MIKREKERGRRINALERELDKLLSANQATLNEYVQTFLLTAIDYEAGSIKDSIANLSNISLLNNIYEDFKDVEIEDFVAAFRSGLEDVLEYNKRYYEQFVPQNRLSEIENRAFNRQLKLLGFSGLEKDKLYSGGYLDSILKSDRPIDQIKAIISRMAFSEVPKDVASRQTRRLIKGGKDKIGILEAEHSAVVNDTYNQVDRQLSKAVADAEGYEFYKYAGDVIPNTRDFCRSRVGKVFHVSEIEKWKGMSWVGKNSPYDPYRDVGGYNCRHQLNGIPTSFALRLRPEAKKFL